jgi:hypothetical protein
MNHVSTLQAAGAAFFLCVSSSAAQVNYVAPTIAQSLSSKSQSYQVGIWSFILFIVCGILAVRALMTIDYSNDTLLTVDIEPSTAEKDE